MNIRDYISRLCLAAFTMFAGDVAAQQTTGIHFEDRLTWHQILSKAQETQKFIFIDCYATWCGPCKIMDTVYLNESLGSFMNEEFISVKYQLDTGKNDEPPIQRSYADAHLIMQTYKPQALPTFLFFSPDGKLVDKGEGVLNAVQFGILAANATNPGKQFYTRIDKFKENKLAYTDMPELISLAREKQEKALSKEIAAKYINEYLLKQADNILFTKDNLSLLANYYGLLTSESPAFSFYLNKGALIDSVMGMEGYSASFIDYVIAKEEISPIVDASRKSRKEPDWKKIKEAIRKHFGDRYSDPDLYSARAAWFKERKDWINYTRYLVLQTESKRPYSLKADAGNVLMLNNAAWDIFQYSGNRNEIKKAIQWTDALLSQMTSPAVLDTKACLLYKSGKKQEAIALEKQAHQLFKEEVKDDNAKGYSVTIQRMQGDEKIWDNPDN